MKNLKDSFTKLQDSECQFWLHTEAIVKNTHCCLPSHSLFAQNKIWSLSIFQTSRRINASLSRQNLAIRKAKEKCGCYWGNVLEPPCKEDQRGITVKNLVGGIGDCSHIGNIWRFGVSPHHLGSKYNGQGLPGQSMLNVKELFGLDF